MHHYKLCAFYVFNGQPICFTQSGQYDNELEEKPFEFSHSQNWREITHFGHSLDARV